MTPAEAHVLSCAHAFAATERTLDEALTACSLNPTPSARIALHTAQDATHDARAALLRAARKLEPQESKFDVVGAP